MPSATRVSGGALSLGPTPFAGVTLITLNYRANIGHVAFFFISGCDRRSLLTLSCLDRLSRFVRELRIFRATSDLASFPREMPKLTILALGNLSSFSLCAIVRAILGS